MSSLSFNEYADSPILLLPPQQHSFYPSSYTHLIQHYQYDKPVIGSESVALETSDSMDITPSTTVLPLRKKRTRDESLGEDFQHKLQRLDFSDHSQLESINTSASSHGLSTASLENQSRGLKVVNDTSQLGTFPPDRSSSALDESSKCNSEEGVNERRKFRRRDIGQDTHATGHPSPTRLNLGLGWKSIGHDPDRQAAARGWAKYIERRFPIHSVTVLARHPNDNILVKAADGIYIFDEAISVAIFIARSLPEYMAQHRENPRLAVESYKLIRPVVDPEFREPGGHVSMSDTDGSPDII
ncbi:MAG: hypothetical protein Q9219_001675 [cf. Caloplaca sp. 3 TL-2023]